VTKVDANWKFDEGSGAVAKDSSGNHHDGTIHGAKWTTGKLGNALNFDGSDDYVDCGGAPDYVWDFDNQDFTIEMWIYTTEPGDFQDENRVINYGGTTYNQYAIRYRTDGRVNFAVRGTTEALAESTSRFDDGKWHHIAAVRDNGNTRLKIYVDGVLEGSTDGGDGNLTNKQSSRRLDIGRKERTAGQSNSYFKGKIDEVNIYNYARTAEQIAYNAGL